MLPQRLRNVWIGPVISGIFMWMYLEKTYLEMVFGTAFLASSQFHFSKCGVQDVHITDVASSIQ